jgi:hypothetical protein
MKPGYCIILDQAGHRPSLLHPPVTSLGEFFIFTTASSILSNCLNFNIFFYDFLLYLSLNR